MFFLYKGCGGGFTVTFDAHIYDRLEGGRGGGCVCVWGGGGGGGHSERVAGDDGGIALELTMFIVIDFFRFFLVHASLEFMEESHLILRFHYIYIYIYIYIHTHTHYIYIYIYIIYI
jgi:hypothetical protein